MLALDGLETEAGPKALGKSHAPAQLDPPQRQEAAERNKTDEVPEGVRRANTTRYLEYLKMVKMERKLTRKILEGPGLKQSAPPPALRGASNGVRRKRGPPHHGRVQEQLMIL